jgi:flagellar basal body-associated protein FliL
MKNLLVLFLSFTMTIAVIAKENETKKTVKAESQSGITLFGIVHDVESKELLTGVEVRIEGTDLKAYTDFDGTFSFNNLTPGDYKLVTNYISYQRHNELLKVEAKQNKVEIKLASSK